MDNENYTITPEVHSDSVYEAYATEIGSYTQILERRLGAIPSTDADREALTLERMEILENLCNLMQALTMSSLTVEKAGKMADFQEKIREGKHRLLATLRKMEAAWAGTDEDEEG